MNFLNTLYILKMRVLRRYHLLGLLSNFLHAKAWTQHLLFKPPTPQNRNIRQTPLPPPQKKTIKKAQFCDPPKTFTFCALALKTPKMYRNDPQNSPICNCPQKISTISSYPPPLKKINFSLFVKTPKSIET